MLNDTAGSKKPRPRRRNLRFDIAVPLGEARKNPERCGNRYGSHVKAEYVYILEENAVFFEIHARDIHRNQEKCATRVLLNFAGKYKTASARTARGSERIEQHKEFVIDMLYTSSREKIEAYRFVDRLSTTKIT